MRWSQLFIPTLRDAPGDAEVASHKLLVRAGFIRQLGAGIYSQLPLARLSLLMIQQIIRQEMERIGAQEFHLPALHPADYWVESGRWEAMGASMFRLKDRSRRDLCLGMTHEEIFTAIARNELRSYRQLPQIWYQIQTKFRDEPRPKSGLLRVREFTMKDSYTFDIDEDGLDKAYQLHAQAYRAIFDRCGLDYLVVSAHSGAMGGSESEEFMIKSEAGEDLIVTCTCGYAANMETATSKLPPVGDSTQELEPHEVHTPGQRTIREVSDFLSIPSTHQIKSLVYIVANKPCLILVRGDHQLNEAKLVNALATDVLRPAEAEEIYEHFGASAGSLGPVGVLGVPIVADHALESRVNMVCGANRDDYHLKDVTPGEDFKAEYHDLREVQSGEACPQCDRSLSVDKALEIGHIFKLGYKYSESMGLKVLDSNGREVPVIMGSYGIGIERILAAAVELFHDELGICWPRSISPFDIVITVVNPGDEAQSQAGKNLYRELTKRTLGCLLDDREERVGVKFKDAELIGIPIRVTVGKKLAKGEIEVFSRVERSYETIPIDSSADRISSMLEAYPL